MSFKLTSNPNLRTQYSRRYSKTITNIKVTIRFLKFLVFLNIQVTYVWCTGNMSPNPLYLYTVYYCVLCIMWIEIFWVYTSTHDVGRYVLYCGYVFLCVVRYLKRFCCFRPSDAAKIYFNEILWRRTNYVVLNWSSVCNFKWTAVHSTRMKVYTVLT